MKQHEAVIKVMEDNGGYATLGFLYQHVLDIPGVVWNTKTPFASMRRIVQDDRFFFKIKPGLWALNSHKEAVLKKFKIDDKSTDESKMEFNHSYFQGLLVEIGNMQGYQTFVPYQDKNKQFLSKKLSDCSTVGTFYPFTYEHVVKRAITIDVVWFNDRNFPQNCFEVEHTGDIQNSLLKFAELQDFYTKFVIVSPSIRKKEFETKLNYVGFRDIKNRVEFIDYDYVSNLHTKTVEYFAVKDRSSVL
jgi:hypothetical protein